MAIDKMTSLAISTSQDGIQAERPAGVELVTLAIPDNYNKHSPSIESQFQRLVRLEVCQSSKSNIRTRMLVASLDHVFS